MLTPFEVYIRHVPGSEWSSFLLLYLVLTAEKQALGLKDVSVSFCATTALLTSLPDPSDDGICTSPPQSGEDTGKLMYVGYNSYMSSYSLAMKPWS